MTLERGGGDGEVAIDVAYAGINFIDVMARRGDPGYASSWPYVPGLEVAGTVRAVGKGVTDRRVGERVAAFTAGGGLAEVAIARDAPGVIGARMTGGGFGGSTINLVAEEYVDEFCARIASEYESKTGIRSSVLVTSASDGASEVTN